MKLMKEGNSTRVGASYFMTFHKVLNSSRDFIGALKSARELSDKITKTIFPESMEKSQKTIDLSKSVFPYRLLNILVLSISVFYY